MSATPTDQSRQPAAGDDSALLEVDDLRVSFSTEDGVVQAVDGVTFQVRRGEVVAIVGESGSGKSVSAMTLMGLTRVRREDRGARGAGRPELRRRPKRRQKVRGGSIAMVFQDPMSSLDPVYRIGSQIVEQIRATTRMCPRRRRWTAPWS